MHHLARAMVLLDASAIARNVGRDLVFPASRRASCSHSDFDIFKPRILSVPHEGPVPHEILGSKIRRTVGSKNPAPAIGPFHRFARSECDESIWKRGMAVGRGAGASAAVLDALGGA